LIRTEAGWLLAATDKGVFRSTDDGLNWQDVSAGLMRSSIFSLAVGAGQRIYCASDTGAVFASADSGSTWISVSGLDLPAVRSLASLLNLPPALAKASLPKAVVRKLLATIENGAEHLAAATDQGVFLSDDQGRSWQPANLGDLKPNESYGVAWTLKSAQNRWKRLVGTDKGVFSITPPDLINPIAVRVQRPGLRLGSLSMPVRALVTLTDNTIFAGTGGGVLRWDDRARSWSPANQGLLIALFSTASAGLAHGLDESTLPDRLRQDFSQNKVNLSQNITIVVVLAGQHWQLADPANGITYTLLIEGDNVSVYRVPEVRSLLFVAPTSLYAGTMDGSVFRSQDNGQTWTNFSHDLRSGEVDGLVASADGIFTAGAPAGSDPDSQWMRGQLQNEQIDLDKIYPEILPDSWIVLRQDGQAALYRIVDVRIQSGKGGRKIGSFSSLEVTGPATLGGFDRRTAQVLGQSEALAQFDNAAISGTRLTFDRFVPGLEPGHTLAMSGKRMRLRLAGSDMVPLQSLDGLAQKPALPGDTLVVMAIPKPASAGGQTWLLQDRNGFTGQATLDDSRAVLVPADDNDETIGEVHNLADVSTTIPTSVILQEPLVALYDRSTVSLSANVVPASHGQTVDSEVLGAAAPASTHPSFILKNKPLTYVPDLEHGGVVSTLMVQVSQVKWHEVNALNDLAGDQRAYMVSQDATDRTEILFGDGEHGARLPGGSDNVSAIYRVGIGEAGNLPPNSLTMLRNRPPGIQAVTNMVAASGGAEPERPDVLRQRAPLQVRNLNRLISLKDYEDYALNFNGIARAQARAVWDGQTRRLHLTVAGDGGAAIDPNSGMYTALIKAILNLRVAGGQPFQVDSYELLVFNLTALLIHDPQDAQNSEELTAAAVQALKTAFSFSAREFEQPAPASEVIAVLQNVSGVRAVELEELYLNGQEPAANTSLEAQPARLVNRKIRPAQLLVINAICPQGIQLTVQEAQ
jgi:photosystem II stability/assembly factor-like uncharacterized protein